MKYWLSIAKDPYKDQYKVYKKSLWLSLHESKEVLKICKTRKEAIDFCYNYSE